MCNPWRPVSVKYTAKNVLCQGPSPFVKCSEYSKYLTTRKVADKSRVRPRNRRCLLQSCNLSDAHAITIVTDEPISTKVLNIPSQTFRSPCGHSTAPVRRMMYVENRAPNNITSEARNNQI